MIVLHVAYSDINNERSLLFSQNYVAFPHSEEIISLSNLISLNS